MLIQEWIATFSPEQTDIMQQVLHKCGTHSGTRNMLRGARKRISKIILEGNLAAEDVLNKLRYGLEPDWENADIDWVAVYKEIDKTKTLWGRFLRLMKWEMPIVNFLLGTSLPRDIKEEDSFLAGQAVIATAVMTYRL